MQEMEPSYNIISLSWVGELIFSSLYLSFLTSTATNSTCVEYISQL